MIFTFQLRAFKINIEEANLNRNTILSIEDLCFINFKFWTK